MTAFVQWSYAEVAAYMAVSEATVRKYLSDGRLPQPDGRVKRSPWWRPETIQQWQTTRPGRGNWGSEDERR